MPRNESTVSKKAKGTSVSRSSEEALVSGDADLACRRLAAAGPVKKAATRKGKSSSYNAYMNTKLSEIKKADPSLKHSDAFKKAMDAWKAEQKGK